MFGTATTLAIYMLSGWITNLISFQFQSAKITLGASGAIFGLMGAMTIFYYMNIKTLSNAKQGESSGS
jgi:membrane associated rhomboid family serine protease